MGSSSICHPTRCGGRCDKALYLSSEANETTIREPVLLEDILSPSGSRKSSEANETTIRLFVMIRHRERFASAAAVLSISTHTIFCSSVWTKKVLLRFKYVPTIQWMQPSFATSLTTVPSSPPPSTFCCAFFATNRDSTPKFTACQLRGYLGSFFGKYLA